MAPTGSLSEGSQTSWPKWQIALVVGAPLAIGLSYWYLKRQPRKENSPHVDDPKAKLATVDRASSIEDSKVETKPSSQIKTPQDYKNLGNQSFKSGNYTEAIEMYNKAIDMCPKDNKDDLSTYYQNRAAAYEQLKNYDKARDDCSSALELNPRYVKALHRRSKAHENLGNLEHSLEDITAACILENFQSEAMLLMADRILKTLGRKHAKEAMLTRKPVMPSKQFIKTYFYSFQEDPSTKFSGATLNGGGDGHLKGYLRAQQAMKEENYDDVLPACNEELDSSESSHKQEALLLRGTIKLLLGEHSAAMTDFNNVINGDQVNIKVKVNALIKRASLFMQLEQPHKCMEDFDTAAELDPENSDTFHHRGQVKLLLEELTQAMEDFEKAVRLNPNFSIAYVQKCYTDFRYAYTTRDMDKVKDVTAKFEDAVNRFPKCTEAYTLYAQVLTEQEEYKKADELYIKAIEVEPTNAAVCVHRAILFLHWTQDMDKATQLIRKAIQVDNKCEFAYETLGTIEVQRANLSEAIKLFNTAIPLAKTELEMAHLFALKDAAVAQDVVAKRLGISMPEQR